MDIVAHTLWAGAAVTLLRRHRPVAPRTAGLTVALAALPDVFQMVPVLTWWLAGGGTFAAVSAFAIAVPGQEPDLPPLVELLSYTPHCTAHSAVVAAAVTLLLWVWRRSLWLPLLGWWSHIVIDVFTHSAAYYAPPVLYPLTERGFDGRVWNTPGFMVLNYLALALVGSWLMYSTRRSHGRHGPPSSRNVVVAGEPHEARPCSRL